MVADTLEVLCDHENIEHALAVRGALRDLRDEILLALVEQAVYHIVVLDDAPCKRQVAAHKGVETVRDHFNGRLRHLVDVGVVAARAGQAGDDLGDVARLIADALDVGDHLEHRGDQTQVARDRLLLEQQLEAHGFDLALLAVDLVVDADRGGGELGVAVDQGFHRARDRVLTQCTHRDQFIVQLCKLVVETVSHISRTSP